MPPAQADTSNLSILTCPSIQQEFGSNAVIEMLCFSGEAGDITNGKLLIAPKTARVSLQCNLLRTGGKVFQKRPDHSPYLELSHDQDTIRGAPFAGLAARGMTNLKDCNLEVMVPCLPAVLFSSNEVSVANTVFCCSQ